MARTKRNAMLIEEARKKIKTTQLINRLQNHVLGDVELSQTQVRSVEILLRKSVPDLSAVEHTGEVELTNDSAVPRPTNYGEWLDYQRMVSSGRSADGGDPHSKLH